MHRAAPMSALSRFVADIRVIVPVVGRTLTVERLPDGRTSLVFRALAEGQGDVAVAGPRTRAHFKNAAGLVRAIVVEFKPGCSAPLLGVAANALTDRTVLLEDLWGRSGRELCQELLAAPSVAEVVERLARALALRTREAVEPASARLARHAVHLLDGGEARGESVAQRLGVTARHLRRVFTESVGIGPKDFARTVRLQRAVRRAATSSDWARIAADAGYYDQSHLIAEFRELVGLTPGAFARRAQARGGGLATIPETAWGSRPALAASGPR